AGRGRRPAAGDSCDEAGNAIHAPNRVLRCLGDVEIVIRVNRHAMRSTDNRRRCGPPSPFWPAPTAPLLAKQSAAEFGPLPATVLIVPLIGSTRRTRSFHVSVK